MPDRKIKDEEHSPPPSIIAFRKSLQGGILLAIATITASTASAAEGTCDQLFQDLRRTVQTSTGSYIHTLWTTNYFVPARNALFMATTEIRLRPQNGDLFGSGTRSQISYNTTDRPMAQTDAVSIRLRTDGKIVFNERYGPYDPTCSGDKFAIVDSNDSVEVFTFKPGGDAARSTGDTLRRPSP